MHPALALLFIVLPLMAQKPPSLSGQPPEVVSLLGKSFFAQQDDSGVVRSADSALAKDPRNVELILAAARARDQRLQFKGSIELYTRAIEVASDDVRPYRYRGHRYISIRKFEEAIRDLRLAAKLAPSSFDVSYHLGLGYYLSGDYQRAADEYARCISQTTITGDLPAGWRTCSGIAHNDDDRVALTEWRYRAQRRGGRHDEARALLDPISAKMDIKENDAYHRTLLFYKGLRRDSEILDPSRMSGNQAVTIGYGVANFLLMEGHREPACRMFRNIVETDQWNAFGYIAAEVELARGRACSR